MVVAITLFLLTTVAISYVAAQSNTSFAVSTGRVTAGSVADNLLSTARAYGCGLETGVATTASVAAATAAEQPGAPALSTVTSQCAALNYASQDVLGTTQPLLGDSASFNVNLPGNPTNYAVTFRTAWTSQSGGANATCPGGLTATQGSTAAEPTPTGAFQSIRINWNAGPDTVSHFFPAAAGGSNTGYLTTFQALPQDILYSNASDGGIVFSNLPYAAGDADSVVVLTIPGWGSIQRVASQYSTGSSGCAWFPYLPSGSGYTAAYYPSVTSAQAGSGVQAYPSMTVAPGLYLAESTVP
jgi:hypothetical protein